MIRHWCEAMSDHNPAYIDGPEAAGSVHGQQVAPPSMLQAWVLQGLPMALGDPDPNDKQRELHRLFDSVGYTGVVATNTEQEYIRYLSPGDQVNGRTVIESISEQKATGLGIGYFIDTRTIFTDREGQEIGWMTFRVLKYQPEQQPAAAVEDSGGAAMPAAPTRLRPALGFDNKWWWEKLDEGEFHIQACADCGVLRHPPRPLCPECHCKEWGSIRSEMKGSIYSYVVMHHPQIPAYDYPLVIAVIDLDEGTRYVGNITGIDPTAVEIGQRVQGTIEEMDPDMKLPIFRPTEG
jgi:uncharacterized OB-fold protein